jgi:hypothetical protein
MDNSKVPKMGEEKSEVGWLVEPSLREIPRKTLEEAKELLA